MNWLELARGRIREMISTFLNPILGGHHLSLSAKNKSVPPPPMPHDPPIIPLLIFDDAVTNNNDLSTSPLLAIILCLSTSSAANLRVPNRALQSFSSYS
jgi:hypothetical protein